MSNKMEIEDTEQMITSDNENDDQPKNNGENEKDEESDDDSDEDDEEKQLEAEAESLERQISENKYLYDVHLRLLDIYEQLADLRSLRAAYKRFSEYFPLTPAIWLKWITKETELATTASQKDNILQMYDKAVEDYLNVDLWLSYAQFVLGNYKLEQTLVVVERALNAAGLHTKHGSLLWDCLREIEQIQLAVHGSNHTSDDWIQQAKKVTEAFRRQLSVPLLDMEGTYSEWQEWKEQLPEGHGFDLQPAEWGYQKALKLLDAYKPFEEKLLTAKDDELFLVYEEYISAASDPATILCLFERGVADLSLNTSLWVKYCLYTFSLGGDIACNVSKRAVRNCSWFEELWALRLRILEQQQCSSQDVTTCFEQGLTAVAPSTGLNLWLVYLEYIRRTSDSVEYVHKVFTQASEQLGETGDPTCMVLRLQARLYARQQDMKNARRIWSHILHFPAYKGVASAWLEYANVEKQYGDTQHLRTLYQRALSACVDWSQYIADEWIMYERECGTLKDVVECEAKCKKIIEANQKLLNQKQAPQEDPENRKRTHESRYDNDGNHKTKRQKTAGTPKPAIPKSRITISDIDSEKAVFVSNMREDVNEEKLQEFFPTATAICIPKDRQGQTRYYAYVQFSEKDEVDKALKRDREPIDERPLFISKCQIDQTQRRSAFKYSTTSEKNKLFVRGLPVKFTQENVEEIFKPHGAIAVRLIMHRSGRSKGIAFIEFKDEEAANQALKATDQSNVSGHIITVAISAPPPKKPAASKRDDTLEPTRHARSRLQLPLIPRSIQNKKPEAPSQGSSKSNDDFRKMFLNKT